MQRLVVLATLLTVVLGTPARAQDCPGGQAPCEGKCIPREEGCNPLRDIADADLVVIEAAPLAPKIAPLKPTWCQGVTAKYTGGQVTRATAEALRSGWGADVTRRIAEGLCVGAELPGFQKQTAYVLQAWANMTGMTAAEIGESFAARLDKEKWDAGYDETCAGLVAGESATKTEKLQIDAQRKLFGCNAYRIVQWMDVNTDDLRAGWEQWAVPPQPPPLGLRAPPVPPRLQQPPVAGER